MPKKNQIQFLVSKVRANGTIGWYWKPSGKLRRLGWKNIVLGEGGSLVPLRIPAPIAAAAVEQNEKLDAWMAGAAKAVPNAPPRRMTFDELVRAYYQHPNFLEKADATKREYRSRLNLLTEWAQQGRIAVVDIDGDMVMDLRNALVANPASSKFRTASILRILGIIMQFAKREMRIIKDNPAHELNIPKGASRTRRLLREELDPLLEAADLLKMPHVRLGIVLGFYTMQRRADLLATTAFKLSRITDISAEARQALAGPDGHVKGIDLQQQKTKAWVSISLVPPARIAVEEAIAAQREEKRSCTHLILFPGEDRPCPDWKFGRDFRLVVIRAVELARERGQGDLAARLDGIMFRDLRRSGMCWMRDLGVAIAQIASNSGHSIEDTQKILDTYMPRDTRSAAEGMAMAFTRQAERDAADQQENKA